MWDLLQICKCNISSFVGPFDIYLNVKKKSQNTNSVKELFLDKLKLLPQFKLEC